MESDTEFSFFISQVISSNVEDKLWPNKMWISRARLRFIIYWYEIQLSLQEYSLQEYSLQEYL